MTTRPVVTLSALFVLSLVLSACTSGPAPETSASKGRGAKVTIELFSFKGATTEIDAGATVTWTQKDDTEHTVTSGTVEDLPDGQVSIHADGNFDSGGLGKGATYRFTFKEKGTYPYFCARHPEGMRAEVVVR